MWINVEDKLPKNKVGVLLLCDSGHIINGYYDHDDKEWVSLFLNGIYDLKIVYWRKALPPPTSDTE